MKVTADGRSPMRRAETILTVGHSTRPIAALLELLRVHGARMLADVRAVPRSRRHPQFDRESLSSALESAGFAYTHRPGLGGRRRPLAGSINRAWRDSALRGFADYMQTEAFERELEGLLALAGEGRVAILCAEARPADCHRALIADALVARGVGVEHILTPERREAHRLHPAARVSGARVSYPGPGEIWADPEAS